MNEIAVRLEGLSKRYRIGERQEPYKTLRHVLTDAVAAPFRRLYSAMGARPLNVSDDNFWALKDVFCEIRRGEVVGIIGRNGAGKSTLLKILSRITEPTAGLAELHGRVSSLLEVGTGFHQELTGRENIYLNGAILGMSRREIDHKFDAIVAFAEVEKFIDTAVKHYSSGMYLRLAFAVAAHLEPEILLVDEVLAVGDANFQKKCLNKMQDVGHGGRTVLFVSHNMPAVTRICERTILLDEGRVLRDGPSYQVISAYLDSGLGTTGVREWNDLAKAPGNEIVRLRAVRVKTENGQISDAVDIRQPVGIEIEYEVFVSGYAFLPHYSLHNQEGVYVFTGLDQDPAWRGARRPAGRYVSTSWIPGNFLSEGTMIVAPAMRSIEPDMLHFYERDAVAFQVIDSSGANTARGEWTKAIPGVVRPLLKWTTQFTEKNSSSIEGATAEF